MGTHTTVSSFSKMITAAVMLSSEPASNAFFTRTSAGFVAEPSDASTHATAWSFESVSQTPSHATMRNFSVPSNLRWSQAQ